MCARLAPGMTVRHFKSSGIGRHGLYEFLHVAGHTETGEELAVYRSLETGKIHVRPLGMFLSRVDREKYPDASQEWRFEECRHRRSWDGYFMSLAELAATRSTCLRRKVGAVAVNPRHRILGTGYNGAPAGMGHCTPETCVRIRKGIPSGTRLDVCKAIHAEMNIVLQLGDALADATLYCTTRPCVSCAKLLMGAGVARIVWRDDYPDEYGAELMAEYGLPGMTDEGFHQIVARR